MPLGLALGLLFQLVQSWIKRAVLNLQGIIAGALDVLGDFVSVSRADRSVRKINMSNVP